METTGSLPSLALFVPQKNLPAKGTRTERATEERGPRLESNVLADFCLWPMAENLQGLIFTDQSDGEKAKKTEETCEDFSKFYLPS